MENQHEMGAVLLDFDYIRLIYKIWIPKRKDSLLIVQPLLIGLGMEISILSFLS